MVLSISVSGENLNPDSHPKSGDNLQLSNFSPDRELINQHLQAFDFKDVCLRAFSKDKQGSGYKDTTSLEDAFKTVEKWQSKNLDCYFVVNIGGQKDSDITQCQAIFYEHDNLPKNQQVVLWQSLGLPEPSLQIDSGGRSIHSYWIFDQPSTDVTAWRLLQTDLLNLANADQSIKNLSRVMRLAGTIHGGSGELCRIVTNSTIRYNFEELRQIIPAAAKLKPEKIGSCPFKPKKSVTVHSAIGDCGSWSEKNSKGQVKGHVSIQLWYYCRSEDFKGQGYVDIDIREAAKVLKKSIYAIRRYITDGLNLKIFRSAKSIGNYHYRIYYSSTEVVAKVAEVVDIGTCFTSATLELPNIKFNTTQATAEQLQRQSKYAESRNADNREDKKLIDPVDITSVIGSGAIYSTGRFTFIRRGFDQFGGSQEKIALNQGRSIATIQRRLSETYRLDHGLDPIQKTQILAPAHYTTSHDGAVRKLAPDQMLINTHLGKYRLCPNIYVLNIELRSCRHLRLKVKHSFPEMSAENPMLEALQEDYKQHLLNGNLQKLNDKQSLPFSKLFEEKNKRKLSIQKNCAGRIYP